MSIASIILSLFDKAPRVRVSEGILDIADSIAVPDMNAGICEITEGAPSYNSHRFLIAPYPVLYNSPESSGAPPSVSLNSLTISLPHIPVFAAR